MWKELKTIYKVCLESAAWYAAAAWMPWLSASRFNVLESAQKKALRIVCGLTKTAPKNCVYEEAEVVPIRVEAKRRSMICYEKAMRCGNEDPRREICERQVDRRLKANKGWREQTRKATDELGLWPREGGVYERMEPWKDVKDGGLVLNVELNRKIRKDMAEVVRKGVVEETLQKYEGWIKVYTDGSVEGGVQNGGAACVASISGDRVVRRKAAGKWCSSYGAEAIALDEALELVKERDWKEVVICTDSQALVKRLGSRQIEKGAEMDRLKRKLMSISIGRRMVIQWVPGHCGVEGNEWADREANLARSERQENVNIWMDAAKRRIEREVKYEVELDERLKKVYSKKIRRIESNRKENVIVAQLRSGHCPKTKYYRHRIGMEYNAACEGCGEVQGKDHWVECQATARHAMAEGFRWNSFGRRIGW